MSEAAAEPTQSLHDEIAAVQKDLGAQVHQVKSEVGQMRAEMRQEMAELRKGNAGSDGMHRSAYGEELGATARPHLLPARRRIPQ